MWKILHMAILIIKWKTLPAEAIIAFLVSAIHILTLAFVSNPIHRFRYPLDPFIYFTQIYLIVILLKTIFSKAIRGLFSPSYIL